jgi:hypothetical protein
MSFTNEFYSGFNDIMFEIMFEKQYRGYFSVFGAFVDFANFGYSAVSK